MQNSRAKSTYYSKVAGIEVPENTKILIGEVKSVELSEEFAHEKLSPVLAMYRAKDFDEAIDKAEKLIEDGGLDIHHHYIYTCSKEQKKLKNSHNNENM